MSVLHDRELHAGSGPAFELGALCLEEPKRRWRVDAGRAAWAVARGAMRDTGRPRTRRLAAEWQPAGDRRCALMRVGNSAGHRARSGT